MTAAACMLENGEQARGPRSEGRGDSRGDAGRGRSHSNERDDAYRTRAPREYGRPAPAPRDPFFDKPYEPSAPAAEAPSPSWESAAKPASRGISANIKPKRKVAALFKSA